MQRAGHKSYPMPFTRVELCVLGTLDGRLCVLLGRREEKPAQGQWALPGGVLRIDLDASLEAAAQRVAQERLGIDLPNLQQQQAAGGPGRDPRSPWSLSIVYRTLVDAAAVALAPGKRLDALRWLQVDAAAADRSLAFDHAALIQAAVADLKADIETLDFPPGFAPAAFTLSELQSRCEQVLERSLDKSSFRRRLSDRGCVEPIAGEFRFGANRPAQLFRIVRTD